MRRLSVPIEPKLLEDFNRAIPWGARQHLIRGLITMALEKRGGELLELAYSEGKGYSIVKEDKREPDTGVESKQSA